mgnify:CR=1 FL=1
MGEFDNEVDAPRGATSREWEVFVRDEAPAPLRHVGSVTAPSVDVAYEQASRLFAWYASDVWLCPADEVARFSTHDLDDEAESVETSEGEEPRTIEP